jgi:aspartate oxidase
VTRKTDVLIIGGGMAGLCCALEIPEDFNVTVLSKVKLPTGSTYLAQGGLAAVTSPADSLEKHLIDTQKAGAGMVDEKAAREIISMGSELVDTLMRLGINLEGANGDGGGMEGGHSSGEYCTILIKPEDTSPNILRMSAGNGATLRLLRRLLRSILSQPREKLLRFFSGEATGVWGPMFSLMRVW